MPPTKNMLKEVREVFTSSLIFMGDHSFVCLYVAFVCCSRINHSDGESFWYLEIFLTHWARPCGGQACLA